MRKTNAAVLGMAAGGGAAVRGAGGAGAGVRGRAMAGENAKRGIGRGKVLEKLRRFDLVHFRLDRPCHGTARGVHQQPPTGPVP